MTRSSRPFLASLLLLTAACGSDPAGPGRIAPPDGYAATPDEAVRLLRDAFNKVSLEDLDHALHPDFEFELSPEDVARLQLSTGSTWDRATQLEWCENMFTGKPGIRDDGVVQSPLDPIFGFTGLWLPLEGEEWTEIPEGPLAGALESTYYGQFQVQYLASDFDFVQGLQTFAVKSRDLQFPEGTATVYEVVHWYSENVPPPAAQKHQTISWGLVMAKFRFAEILDPPAGYASSPDEVVSLLQQAYTNHDAELLGRLLHPTFLLELDPAEASEFSLAGSVNAENFAWWTSGMFAGLAGQRADGSDQAGLDLGAGVSGAWTAVDAGWTLVSQGPYIQTLERRFESPWTATFSDQTTETVDGVQTFNVVEGVVAVGDALARVHQLRRWASAPPEAAGAISWGRLTAWYRRPLPILR